MRNDRGGTVSGRFSYSNPNLQQVPNRDPEIGNLIRSLFIPEDGCQWGFLITHNKNLDLLYIMLIR